MKPYGWTGFLQGMVLGAMVAVGLGVGVLYALNMANVIVLTMPLLPEAHQLLAWIYENLRLSVIPFALTLVLYTYSLRRLSRYLESLQTPPEKVVQAEHLVDIWINLFFGIGVIWTAIGIRSALLTALGDLDPLTAAELGAFTILQRLVDGGILLALSTTIFGAIGGYLLRVIKAFVVGARLQAYYGAIAQTQMDQLGKTLHSIEDRLTELVTTARTRTEVPL